ncbi:radial spoke head protein 3 homolog B [Nilaparvata lugens]|uniref:radial spoke head protein 3 homolog B n=1 Tax=Nilaparvata lugens TaxID=108931 RepID=UPI00193C99A8|nr:radial spoke head protein 3 homolog B [Nilaparvata lugens]
MGDQIHSIHTQSLTAHREMKALSDADRLSYYRSTSHSFVIQPKLSYRANGSKLSSTSPRDSSMKTSHCWRFRNVDINKKSDDSEVSKTGYHGNCYIRRSQQIRTIPKPILRDRKVVFGTTVSRHPPHSYNDKDRTESEAARLEKLRKRKMELRKIETDAIRDIRLRLGTPPAVEGRIHEDVQTEVYLEELFDNPTTNNVSIQTSIFHDRPDSPPFIPAKVGTDVATQIMPGELFDFDVEVRPILEVLVGATLEQAIIEVLEEDQLASIRANQRRLREIKAAEEAEYERLEEEETRKRQEKDRRITEHMRACELQKEVEERVAAAVLTTGYIADLLPSVLEGLNLSGYLRDNIKEDVENNFLSWIMQEVTLEMRKVVDNRDILSDIVREVLVKTSTLYEQSNELDDNYVEENRRVSLISGNEESIQEEEDGEQYRESQQSERKQSGAEGSRDFQLSESGAGEGY